MEIIKAPAAPAAIGPYSHAIVHNHTVYCSGQIALDPETMEMVGTTVQEQTGQAMKNVKAVLEAAGTSLDKILKATIFLDTMDDFSGMNQVYEEALKGHKPARSAFEVGRLPKGALVEIECIAAVD
ncbi:Rid family detoxifying hydrolase [Desulfospira joergensenii]|uniref:Rid family detoxifying hydrolase n=1 Tax=Desulfospira joergensenii TaxID=53329 RepID=UPI0003B39DF8|nr:Rid family detoxifying hydrolase [Desulfospira joergensenii]